MDKTQREIVLEDLEQGDWVPVSYFLSKFISRTSAIVFNLKREGYRIESRQVAGKSYQEYRLLPKETLF